MQSKVFCKKARGLPVHESSLGDTDAVVIIRKYPLAEWKCASHNMVC